MKKIGLIVAVELDSVLNKYGKPVSEKRIDGFNVLTYNIDNKAELYVVHCGAGEISAASATQLCISKLKCSMILNFGIVGGLTNEMSETKLCVVEKIVHYDFDVSADDKRFVPGQHDGYPDAYIPATKSLIDTALKIEPELKKVIIASGDKFIDTASKKRDLHNKFNADICDMEAAGIALTCDRTKIPYLMIKCVSDGCNDDSYNSFLEYFTESAEKCFDVMDKIIKKIF